MKRPASLPSGSRAGGPASGKMGQAVFVGASKMKAKGRGEELPSDMPLAGGRIDARSSTHPKGTKIGMRGT